MTKKRRPRTICHQGQSMHPSIREGDILDIAFAEVSSLKRGDVIAFRPGGEGRLFVHRVVDMTPEGFRTRGDNGDAVDPWLVRQSEIAGRVDTLRRGQKHIRLPRGLRARATAHACRARLLLLKHFGPPLSSLYRTLSGLVPPFMPATLRPQVVVFRSDAGSRRRMMVGSRVIGTWDDDRGWHIKKRWRPFIDRSSFEQPRGSKP